tara:strand:+ start:1370 stop:2923 length:1554 start_codon:yes stop_codon:yes gene_type:complete
MPVLVQPTTTQVDPNQALNVFQTLQEGHRRKELVDAQVAKLSSDLAMEKQLQTGRMEEQSLKLESLRIKSATEKDDRRRNLALREEWNPEEFSGAIDEIEKKSSVLARREMLAETFAEFSRFKGIPEAADFMEQRGGSYGERLDEEWEIELRNGDLELFSSREKAREFGAGYGVRSITNPFTGITEYAVNYEKIDSVQESQALMEIQALSLDSAPENAYSAALKSPTIQTMSRVSQAVKSLLDDLRKRSTDRSDDGYDDSRKLENAIVTKQMNNDFDWVDEFTESAQGTGGRILDLSTGIGLLLGTEEENGFPINIEESEPGRGGVRTGFGAKFNMQLAQIGERLGMEVPKLAKTEQLFTILGSEVMARVSQTKGAVSDKEMALFEAFSAGPSKSVAGNLRILRYGLAIAKRTQEMQGMVDQAMLDRKNPTQIRRDLLSFRQKFELPNMEGMAFQDDLDAIALKYPGSSNDILVEAAMQKLKERTEARRKAALAVDSDEEIINYFKPVEKSKIEFTD